MVSLDQVVTIGQKGCNFKNISVLSKSREQSPLQKLIIAGHRIFVV
jgi:hypothetical protein